MGSSTGMYGNAAGAGAAGLGSLFAPWKNPADSADQYYDQIPDYLKQYLGPMINNGSSQYPGLNNQYSSLMNDPGGRINQIGQSYHQSPGFQFAMQQALQGANHAAAAGGMAGSPEHEQQNMTLATNLANQDYNSWMQNALGQYDVGLQGSQGLYNTGAQASMGMGEDMANVLLNRSKLAYAGQNAENQHEGNAWGSIFGAVGTGLGSYFGGPFGAAMGNAAGKAVGGG